MNCDPCDSTQPAAAPATTGPDLQVIDLASLPSLPDPSCGFQPEEPPYQDTLVSEQPLDLGQAFMASQIPDISIPMTNGMPTTTGSEVTNSVIER